MATLSSGRSIVANNDVIKLHVRAAAMESFKIHDSFLTGMMQMMVVFMVQRMSLG